MSLSTLQIMSLGIKLIEKGCFRGNNFIFINVRHIEVLIINFPNMFYRILSVEIVLKIVSAYFV